MALFKVLRGDRANLDNWEKVPFHDGYAYFCSDTGEFFIDCENSSGKRTRKQLIGGGIQAQIIEWGLYDEIKGEPLELNSENFDQIVSFNQLENENEDEPYIMNIVIPRTIKIEDIDYKITSINDISEKIYEISYPYTEGPVYLNIPATIVSINQNCLLPESNFHDYALINYEGSKSDWINILEEIGLNLEQVEEYLIVNYNTYIDEVS